MRPYSGVIDCYRKSVKADGIRGLWVGLGPNVMRNSVINAAELASYDQFKQIAIQDMGMGDTFTTQCVCGFSAGCVATLVGSPMDVLKNRLQNLPAG